MIYRYSCDIHASPLECKISMQAGYAVCDGCLIHVHVWSTFSGAHIIVHFTYCRYVHVY